MSDFENFHVLHKALGDYWYSYFSGSEQVGTYVNAVVELQKQVEQTMKELERSLSRKEIDIFRTYRNYPLKFKLSEFNKWSEVYPKYDGKYYYNSSLTYSTPIYKENRVKIPSKVVSIGKITNKIDEPDLETIDFSLEEGYLTLPFNPFEENFVVNELSDGDKEVVLWLRDVKLDFDDLYIQFGYALGIKLPSSERYKEIINAYTDCLVNGGSKENVLKFIKAVAGADGELTNDVLGIVLPEGFLGNCFSGGITLLNQDLEVEISTQEGFTRLDLPIRGSNTDKFNDVSFQKGVEACVEVTDECELRNFRELTGIEV